MALLAYMNGVFLRADSEYLQPLPVMLARALSPARHAQILTAAFRFMIDRPQWPLALIALAAVVSGWRPASRDSQGRRAVLVALLVVAAGFYAVYLTTPYDLGW